MHRESQDSGCDAAPYWAVKLSGQAPPTVGRSAMCPQPCLGRAEHSRELLSAERLGVVQGLNVSDFSGAVEDYWALVNLHGCGDDFSGIPGHGSRLERKPGHFAAVAHHSGLSLRLMHIRKPHW